MGATVKNKTNEKWAVSGEPLSKQEFEAGIKKAESGTFHSIKEAKEIIKEWRVQKSSK